MPIVSELTIRDAGGRRRGEGQNLEHQNDREQAHFRLGERFGHAVQVRELEARGVHAPDGAARVRPVGLVGSPWPAGNRGVSDADDMAS